MLYNFTGSDGRNPFAGVVIGDGGVLYGTTYQGGSGTCGVYGCGTVYSLTPPASPGGACTETVLYNFVGYPNGDGTNPTSTLILGSGGVLYGTTSYGGASNDGTVFSLTPPTSAGAAWTEAVLYSFMGGSDGISPYAGVVLGDDGVLYGTTGLGGLSQACSGCGTVFSLTPPVSPGGAWTETQLYAFSAPPDGSDPEQLVIGSGGVLYGLTSQGGTSNNGTVFSLTPPASPGGAWTEAVLHRFTGAPSDGSTPLGGLVIGKGGALYGTSYSGGNHQAGTLFSLTPPTSAGGSWTEALLHQFRGYPSDGAFPKAGLAIGNGELYGTTYQGGASHFGTVFRWQPD